MTSRRCRAVLSACSLVGPLGLLLASPAWGQAIVTANPTQQPVQATTPDPSRAPAEQATAELTGDIVVTARRREESLQAVPVAVTAITPEDLQRRGISSGAELVSATPSLQVQPGLEGRTAARFYIRGQGVGFGGAPPSVVAYFNEVPLDINGGATFALNDVQTVQVLRGPQGTLFGRNANGGVVLIAPTPPSDHPEGYVDMSFGNYDYVQVNAAASVPISSTLGLRVSGQIRRRDGYTRNLSGKDLDNFDNRSVRAFLRWQPTDGFKNDLVYNYFEGDSNGIGTILSAVRPNTAAALAYPRAGLTLQRGPGLTADLAYQQSLGPRTVDDPSTYYGERNRIHLITNTTSINIGDVTLKNIFGYEHVNACASTPITATRTNFYVASCFDNYLNQNLGLKINPTNVFAQITEEVNASADLLDGRLEAIAGAFFLWDKPTDGAEFGQFRATRASKSLFIANVTSAFKDDRSQAAYGQATYKLTDGLSITAGVRHTWDQRQLQYGQFTSSANGAAGTFRCVTPGRVATAGPNDCVNIYKAKFDDWGYTFGLDWKATSDLLLYAQTRRGYKSGGFNETSASAAPLYGPEVLKDVEVGAKYSFGSSAIRGRLNAAYFHMWYDGIQQQLSIIDAITGGATVVTTNAGGAQADGVELEANLTFFNHFNLSGFYTFMDSRYNNCPSGKPVSQLVPADCFIDAGRDVTDSKLLNSPRNTFSVTGSYTQPLGDVGNLTGLISYYTRSSQAFAADNVINFEGIAPGYQIVNARLGLEDIGHSGISVAAFVNNVFDRDYISSGQGLGGLIGTTALIYGEPRTYGLNLRATF